MKHDANKTVLMMFFELLKTFPEKVKYPLSNILNVL